MNGFKEWYIGHIDDCEHCQDIEQSDRPEAEKARLIDEHTMDAFGNFVDTVHETYKANA